MIDLTPIFQAAITLIAALVTYKLIPWIKARTTAEQQENLLAISRTLVFAAEQLYGAGNGEIKMQHVVAGLKARGYSIDFEIIEAIQPIVVKKDGSKELFDRNKLLSGVLKACQKRPVNAEDIVSDIEAELYNSLNQEVKSRDLGEMVMRKLKAIDKVAYVRFASVYREFQDIDTFFAELKELKEEKNN